MPYSSRLLWLSIAVPSLFAAACSGELAAVSGHQVRDPEGDAAAPVAPTAAVEAPDAEVASTPADSAASGPSAAPNATSVNPAGQPSAQVEVPSAMPNDSAEAFTFPVHHLTAAEYNNTVADLLGTSLRPADFFPAAGTSEFDANVGVLASLSQVSVQGYLDAARDLAADSFAREELRARIVTCDVEADEPACVSEIIAAFGARAFRRPLATDEVARYLSGYNDSRSMLDLNTLSALQQVVRTILSSPHFFLRVELGAEALPGIETPSYALASRLSYLVWTSMPDEELFRAAESDELARPEAVEQQLMRLLESPKRAAFYRDFFGQWLGTRSLTSHNADSTLFPVWNSQIRDAQLEQVNQYFTSFVDGSHSWSEILTAPHPEQAALASLFERDPDGIRQGFLTLPAFLTQASHADRTSPTARATSVIGGLLCTIITPPANVDIPDLSASDDANLAEDNIRARLEQHRAAPDCAGCHAVLDPIGLSLEHFDAIGQYREAYGNGDAIDTTGEYLGTGFRDVQELIPLLQQDTRLSNCPPRKLYTYAMRRSPTSADLSRISSLSVDWNNGNIGELMQRIVTSDAFLNVLQARALEGDPQ